MLSSQGFLLKNTARARMGSSHAEEVPPNPTEHSSLISSRRRGGLGAWTPQPWRFPSSPPVTTCKPHFSRPRVSQSPGDKTRGFWALRPGRKASRTLCSRAQHLPNTKTVTTWVADKCVYSQARPAQAADERKQFVARELDTPTPPLCGVLSEAAPGESCPHPCSPQETVPAILPPNLASRALPRCPRGPRC